MPNGDWQPGVCCSRAGLIDEAGAFVPTPEKALAASGSTALNLAADYQYALTRKSHEPMQLMAAWNATQTVLGDKRSSDGTKQAAVRRCVAHAARCTH